MTEIIVARPVIPAIFAFHSAILGARRYRAAPELFRPRCEQRNKATQILFDVDGLTSRPEVPRFPPHNFFS